MPNFLKGLTFLLLFVLLTQIILGGFLPAYLFYNDRPIYDVFKDNTYSMETTIKQVKRIIASEKIEDYIILLGDSVMYGGVCPPENSLAFYMNELAKNDGSKIRVFNLSAPSMMLGDIYAMIRLMQKYNLSTDHLIIETSYIQFACRYPVFWLKHYVDEFDPEGYRKLVNVGLAAKIDANGKMRADIYHEVFSNLAFIEYRHFISTFIRKAADSFFRQPAYPVLPWTKKAKTLREYLNKKENRWYYTDRHIPMNETNFEVYYLNKILDLQKGKKTLFFLAAMNDELLGENVLKPGYIRNMNAINEYFASRDVQFIDFNKKIDSDFFSDNIHLTPDGYKFIAKELWTMFEK